VKSVVYQQPRFSVYSTRISRMAKADNPVERLLCCNVLTSDEYSQPNVFRHPFYTYDGPITWPPPEWKQGKCLYCAHAFDRPGTTGSRIAVPPVPLPCFFDKRTGLWRVTGIFCSWNCAKAELLHTQGYGCGDGSLLIEQLARKVFKYSGPTITPAPPRARLSYFYPGSETLSIDDFRQDSAMSFTTVVSPPLLSSPEVYERHSIPAETTPWTVKGIRAKTYVSSTSEVQPEESNDAGGHGQENDKACMFLSFVRQKEMDSEQRGAESAGDADCNIGGTLMDWRDSKLETRTKRKSDRED